MYKFIIIALLTSSLYALVDSDMDGVEDSIDQCPNTSITDLVDLKGCSLESLKSEHKYSISIGSGVSQVDTPLNGKTETYNSTLQTGYTYKNYSFNTSMGYTSSDNSNGLSDTTLSAGYNFDIYDNLRASVGLGIVFPTYDSSLNNNNTDYLFSLNTTYTIDKLNLFAGYSFTKNNDDDVLNVIENQDSNSYNIGLGYYLNTKLYMSGSYSISDNTSKNEKAIKQASLFTYYSFDDNWSANISYGYGLSSTASDHSLFFSLGHAF